jgi:hypothetical protein
MVSLFDTFVGYKFIKILTMPWKKTEAYKRGLIDAKGFALVKRKDIKTGDRKHFTILHTLIWNIKRLLDKLPPTKTRLGSFAVALWMLKDKMAKGYVKENNVEEAFLNYLEYEYDMDCTEKIVEQILVQDNLPEGSYEVIGADLPDLYDGVEVGDEIVLEDCVPIDTMLGTNVYQGIHTRTGRKVAFTDGLVQEKD